MGNNPCYPYDSCMSTHIGDDVDIITWEQVNLFLIYSYYLFNILVNELWKKS